MYKRKPKVVHCHKEDYDVYVGRPSRWGNPFVIGQDGNREETIEKFRQYLLGSPTLLEAVKTELRGKVLGCWCKPQPCHGDILLQIANEGAQNDHR